MAVSCAQRAAVAKADLLPYQQAAALKILENEGSGGLFLEMGTGKTRVALEIARRLGCKRLLIVAPLSAVGVWGREIGIYWPSLEVVDGVTGTVRERGTRVGHPLVSPSRAWQTTEVQKARAVIVGYETYWREPLRKAILKYKPDMVIYDEAHRLANRGSKQSRFAHILAGHVSNRIGLTGTPMPKGIEDLFSVYKALLPEVFGKRWWEFERQYLVKGGYMMYQITGYRNQDEVERKLATTSFRITKDEALDLPERMDVVVPLQLDSRDIYDELRLRAIAEVEGLEDGQPATGTALSRIVLTNVLRLQQVSSGFVKLTDGRIIDLSFEKSNALQDLLSDMIPQAGRIVVFCRFRHDVDRAAQAAEAECPNVFVLDGRVPPSQREKLLQTFREEPKAVLVVQIAVGALGIDLSCAHVAILYSLDYSYVNYAQSKDRLHRLGQEHKVTYYHLLLQNTVDEKVMAALEKKENLSRSILDLSRARAVFE